MKTFIKIAGILCLLSVFLTFPACGSDDDDDNDNPDNPGILLETGLKRRPTALYRHLSHSEKTVPTCWMILNQ